MRVPAVSAATLGAVPSLPRTVARTGSASLGPRTLRWRGGWRSVEGVPEGAGKG